MNISQVSSGTLKILDETPVYSNFYRGGYGGQNPQRSEMLRFCCIVYIDGLGYELEFDYDHQSLSVDVESSLITIHKQVSSSNNCLECVNEQSIDVDNSNKLSSFPSGCLDIEVYFKYFDQNKGSLQCTAKTKRKLILYWNEEQLLIRAINKFPFNMESVSPFSSEVERERAMNDLVIAWSKLQNINADSGCSCECVSGVIKSVSIHLNNTKWLMC